MARGGAGGMDGPVVALGNRSARSHISAPHRRVTVAHPAPYRRRNSILRQSHHLSFSRRVLSCSDAATVGPSQTLCSDNGAAGRNQRLPGAPRIHAVIRLLEHVDIEHSHGSDDVADCGGSGRQSGRAGRRERESGGRISGGVDARCGLCLLHWGSGHADRNSPERDVGRSGERSTWD